jgi:protein-S-isoprenylcysteine O-methyltransferase Ste14
MLLFVDFVSVQRPQSNTSSLKKPKTVPCAIPFTGTTYMHLLVGKLTSYVPLSAALTQGVLYVPMFWSYYSFAALAATTTAIAIKIPVEEKILEDDLTTGPAYERYKEKVPWRVIPYLW